MMDCAQVTRLAGDYIERRLRLRQRLGMLLHLLMCRGCKDYVEQIRLTMFGLRAVPRPAGAPPGEDLLREFRQARRERKS